MTDYANVREELADTYVGKKVVPWLIGDMAKECGATFIQAGRFKALAVRDGRLIRSTAVFQYGSGKDCYRCSGN